MESEISALKLAFSINNEWFEWSTIVVLAGLVFELVTLLAFHKSASWREKSILIAGTLVIAIGVAGEWHFGSKASAAALRLQAISDEKVAALAKDTADARKDAANAIERSTKLEKEAAAFGAQIADANARALQAQAALEKFKTPRTLMPEQQTRVASKIRKFAGQEYAFSVGPGSEPSDFLVMVDKALTLANWVKIKPFGTITTETPAGPAAFNSLSGVRIQVASIRESELRDAAAALAGALKDEDIDAFATQIPKSEIDERPTIIQVVIGIKPVQ